MIAGTVPREGLWRAQTPQGFRYPAILDAHRAAAGGALTDDAAVAEHAGLAVALTTGDEDNLKITTEQDFSRAERILAAQGESAVAPAIALETRVGMGFDVHRFGPGDHLMLGGVAVPHEQGVVSHSDGDVVLHAIVDAVLGAMAAGDIGTHFPPTDETWRDADSTRFVAHTLLLLRGTGRPSQPYRCHSDLPTAQDRPPSPRHGGEARRRSRPRSRPHQPEGDDHRAPRLHRAGRRHRRAGGRHGPPAC